MESQAGIVPEQEAVYETETETAAPQKRTTFCRPVAKNYLRRTLVLWVIWFGINFGYYGFVLWTPSLLVARALPW